MAKEKEEWYLDNWVHKSKDLGKIAKFNIYNVSIGRYFLTSQIPLYISYSMTFSLEEKKCLKQEKGEK